jgi:hypothetical protein
MSSTYNGMPAATLRDAAWTKSSYSGPTGGNCVELAHLYGGQVAIRNSRHPTGPALLFTAAEWDAFLAGAKDGEFDRQQDDLGVRAVSQTTQVFDRSAG